MQTEDKTWLLMYREPNLTHPEDAYVVLGPGMSRWQGRSFKLVAAGCEDAVRAAKRLMSSTNMEIANDL